MAKKLRPKYVLFRIDEEKLGEEMAGSTPSVTSPPMLSTNPDDVDSPFVLMPRKDPAAFYALCAYAQACESDLRIEIVEWLEKIVEVDPVYGTQGSRNRKEMKLKQIDLST